MSTSCPRAITPFGLPGVEGTGREFVEEGGAGVEDAA